MGLMLDGTETYDWWVEDYRGRKWELFGDSEGNRGATFEGIDNAENSISRELAATSHQIGQRLGGYSVPALEPTLTVALNTRRCPGVWLDWGDAWSQKRENKLFVASPIRRRVKHLTVRQKSGKSSPEGEPHLSGLVIQPTEMLALGGVWLGNSVHLSAGDSWFNDGDLPPEMHYLPAGAGGLSLSVGSDTWSATHSAVLAGSRVELDPDEMMKTFVGDVAVPELWQLWRNQWNPLRVEEGQELSVGAASGLVVVTPRYLGPW